MPVPKLYGYSSPESNPVGVEYIVMEKAPGVGLETKWPSMDKRDLHKLASSFVEIEKKKILTSLLGRLGVFTSRKMFLLDFKLRCTVPAPRITATQRCSALAQLQITCSGMGNELVSVCTVDLVCSSHGLISRCPVSDYRYRERPQEVPCFDCRERNRMDWAVWKAGTA
jgi:hypothetical protein